MFRRKGLPRKFAPSSCRPVLEQLENRLAPSAVSWTGGAGTLNWSDANNWSTSAVPTSTDDVTISKSGIGTINIGAGTYAVRSLNDTTASLAIASGGSLSLAGAASSTLGQNVTVQSGGTLTLGTGANVQINNGVTITDSGTFSVTGAATVVAQETNNSFGEGISVSSGGTLDLSAASSTSFTRSGTGVTSFISVAAGGHLLATGCTFAFISLTLANSSILNSGDLSGNAFDTTLSTPVIDVPLLTNNLRFHDVDINGGSLLNGQNVQLGQIGTQTAANLRYVFPAAFSINSAATLTLATGANFFINNAVTITDSGTLSVTGAASVVAQETNNSFGEGITVTSGGTLDLSAASGTSFTRSGTGVTSFITVAAGGHLLATGCTFAFISLTLANSSTLNSGDLSGNAFDTTLSTPVIDVPLLTNNLRFQDVDINGGSLLNGQAVTLGLMGTQTAANLRYVFPAAFTVKSGALLTLGAGVNVQINNGVTITDSGTLSVTGAASVVAQETNNSFGEGITVTSGGTLDLSAASGTSFTRSGTGVTSFISVAAGGHLLATGCTFAFISLTLANDSILNSGDLSGNAFDTTLSTPVIDVPLLTNNLRFQDVDINGGSLLNGQAVTLGLMGTQTAANLRYVFAGAFTVKSGALLTLGAGVNVQINNGVTITDSGTFTVTGAAAVVAQETNNSFGEGITVTSGGTMAASGASFTRSGTGVTSFISVAGNGSLQASSCTFAFTSLTLNNNSIDALSMDTIYGTFTINSGANIGSGTISTISENDFSNLGTNALVAVGNANATINLAYNYWGTTDPTQIAAKIDDHAKDATRPTVLYSPPLPPNQPPVLATISNQVVNEGTTVAFTASATDSDGDTITYSLDPGAPAGATINASTGAFSYTPDRGPTSHTIVVRATDNGFPPLSAVQSFTITVNDVAPTASLTGPTDGFKGVQGQTRAFIVGATSPSHADQVAGFTYDLSWGDGSADTIVSGLTGTTVTHVFGVAGTYTVTATVTDLGGGPSAAVSLTVPILLAEVQNGTLIIGGTPGNDTFDLTPGSHTNDISVTVNGTAVGTFSTNGQAQVFGNGGGGDVLNFDDQANTVADLYFVTASTVGRTNAATITYSSVGTINLKAGTKANTIDVESTAAGTTVNLTMGNGANTINVGSIGNTLDGLLGQLTVTGGTGNNTAHLNDQGSSAAQTYTIAATTVSRSGAEVITYSNMKKLALAGSSGTDTTTIVNTASTTPVTVTGGGGANTLLGPNVTSTWTLTGANSGTVGNVTFSGVANLAGGSGNDTFKVNAAGSLSGTIDGGDGTNKLDYSTFGGPVTVNLQTGAATATGGMLNIGSVTGSTAITNLLIGPNTPNTWSITGVNAGKVNAFSFTSFANLTGGIDSDVFKFSNAMYVSGVIDGGGVGDWLDYSAYTTAITVNLTTGAATGVNGGVHNIQNVRAGSGGSTLTGNALGNILVGGAGADTIIGGSGRSLLIGGKGNDSVTGGSGNDIIIGGYTTFDNNNAALMSILAEWQRTDETYSQRISNLRTGAGLNGKNKLIFGTTIKDDGGSDTLTGGPGGMDWYFEGQHDTITNLQPGEQVN